VSVCVGLKTDIRDILGASTKYFGHTMKYEKLFYQGIMEQAKRLKNMGGECLYYFEVFKAYN